LVIDCTSGIEENFSACYDFKENKVKLKESTLEGTELNLLINFAHELKHAEQYSEELYKMQEYARNNDGLMYHQLEYLTEAQAYAFEEYVEDLFYAKEKGVEDKNIRAFSDVESIGIKDFLQILYEKGTYRDDYDWDSPILRKNKGLTVEEIPASFHFRDKREALSWLKDMPREARTLKGRRIQLQKEYFGIFTAISCGSTERLKQLVDKGLKSGKIIPDELLTIIGMEFSRSEYSPENAEQNKDMLNYFLNLEVDGKPLMQEGDISDLLDGARASGRKDVEDALLAYKTKHPLDKRFFEEMFNPNSKDKVKEFKERQEMKAAEVKAAVENAANKDVSALTATIKAAKSK